MVHCYAGISRSTAGAFVTACALNPQRDEMTIARALRDASPTATPNIRIVSLADRMLGRDGRMVAAIRVDRTRHGGLCERTVPARSRVAMADTPLTPIEIGLTAAIVAVEDGEPAILVAGDGRKSEPRAGLPFGPFDPLAHRTFEIGLRAWVEAQTGLRVGYVEQLYTFGDRGRHAGPADVAHMVSVGYLALTRMPESAAALKTGGAGFEPWYRFFPVGGLAREAPRDPRRHDHPAARANGPARRMANSAARSAGASGCGSASASAARRGTRRRCSTATRCSTRPA